MGRFRDFMARRCDDCPLCRWARDNPQTVVGKIMAWHWHWCPAARAWEEVHGKPGGHQAQGTKPRG